MRYRLICAIDRPHCAIDGSVVIPRIDRSLCANDGWLCTIDHPWPSIDACSKACR